MNETDEFTLDFEGDVKVTVTYPSGEAVDALRALRTAGSIETIVQVAEALVKDAYGFIDDDA